MLDKLRLRLPKLAGGLSLFWRVSMDDENEVTPANTHVDSYLAMT